MEGSCGRVEGSCGRVNGSWITGSERKHFRTFFSFASITKGMGGGGDKQKIHHH